VKRSAGRHVLDVVRAVVLLVSLACCLVAAPASALDAAPWDRVLRAHARGGGVDYASLASDPVARADLDRFLADVAGMPEDAPLASWIDAYNAIVVREIVRRWPIESVRSVSGFFDRARHRVAGAERTLDDLEHRVIRARFRDARIHAALVCGARSCPALQPRAFSASRDLDAELDRVTREWLESERHLRVERGAVRGSAILTWYRADFERDGGTVIRWLRRHAPGRLSGIPDDTPVAELPYDWAVNAPR